MEMIRLEAIHKNGGCIKYDFEVTQGLASYFSGNPFEIYYTEDVTGVPDGIAAVPFVCNVLPIIWLTDSLLVLPELDKTFYECIPEVKKGYETMFPESVFAGRIEVERIVACDRPSEGRCAAFFSGGLDATQTLVSHFDEKPDLISIWGSDIRFDNAEGWNNVHKGIEDTCKRFQLKDVVIRSSFREFDNEGALDARYSKQLQDGWWHGVKHGLGLLGHAAPYAYLNGLGTVYIASSNCPADGQVRCASSPLIDDYVRFAGCQVIHDGYLFSRQDKASNVVNYCRDTGRSFFLHACWQSQSGQNCCRCEKCYRTMAALMAEGADPAAFGFFDAELTAKGMRNYLIGEGRLSSFLATTQWIHIHNRIVENRRMLRDRPFWKHIKWIERADFSQPSKLRMPLRYRMYKRLVGSRFYRFLRRLKER